VSEPTGAAAAAALLEAGAVLPPGAPVTGDGTVDAVTTRAYRHPALAERPVVRLVPRTLGEAEDLTMEYLGFARPEQVAEVGLVRHQALGFPAWALVNDPANGHHALALVKEVERLARVARSRTGAAKDGFDQLGERLSRSVPHFLPTFYEQAGRAFLAAESRSYAAMLFGRAREAERVYALAVDEERRHAVFLEFALAGALTAKALSAHARDLAARCEPAVAYERFRRLCVERTLGGLPPYAAMAADLGRLARGAGLDQAAAGERVLADLLPAPALARAPEAFWTGSRAALARLAAARPEVRGRLLAIMPERCGDRVWLELLEETGATAALSAPAGTVPAAAEPPDGPAGWLSRFARHRTRRSGRLPALLSLVERMAPRLIADGTPVDPYRWRRCDDLDLLDACLAHRVPVADPPQQLTLHVTAWLDDDTEPRRDLAALAADGRFLPALARAVEGHLDRDDLDRARQVVAVPGLAAALRAWLDGLAEAVERHGLPALGAQLDRVRLVACPEALGVNPQAVRRIARHDLGPVLGRTLRCGVLDEYGWPALEAAAARLAPARRDDDDEAVHWTGQWPAAIVRRGDQVVVAGPDGVLLEHLLRIPAGERRYLWRLALRFVDGQLLVCWDTGPDRSGYWTGTPDDVFTGVPDAAFSFGQVADADGSLPLPGGGRTAGGRPLHVGDRSEHRHGRMVAADGTSHWVLVHGGDGWAWTEYDPATGELARASLPRFFEEGAADGQPLEVAGCSLRPAPPGAESSPLGAAGGLVGWRVRRTPDGGQAGEGVDGRAFGLPPGGRGDRILVGAVRFPGSELVHGLLYQHEWRGSELAVRAADGFEIGRWAAAAERPAFARGTPLVADPHSWHHLRPRDPAGSAVLRALTDAQAASLLAGAAGRSLEEVRALVAAAVPGIGHPELATGVAGIVQQAAGHAAALRELAAVLEGTAPPAARSEARSAAPPGDAGLVDDAALARALDGLIQYCYTRGTSAARLLLTAGRALAAADEAPGHVDLDGVDLDWFDTLGLVRAAMYRAASPWTPPASRQALLGLLDTLVRSGLIAPGGRTRRVRLTADGRPPQEGDVLATGTRRLLALRVSDDDDQATVDGLEHAPDGGFGPVPGHRILAETVVTDGTLDPAAVERFAALVRERGPAGWPPRLAAEASAAAGISHAEAAVLLAALGDADAAADDPPDGQEPDRGGRAPAAAELPVPPAAASMARRTWGHLPREVRVGLLGGLLPPEPSRLWSDGPDLGGLLAWAERRGRRTPVRDELIAEVHRAGVAAGIGASELLHGLANPRTCAWLAVLPSDRDGSSLLGALARSLAWLAYHLPVEDPLRAQLPVALDLIRGRLADPRLAVWVGWVDDDEVDRLAAALGTTPVPGADGTEVGPFVLPPEQGWRTLGLRPALLSGLDDPALALLRSGSTFGYADRAAVAALRALLGDRLPGLLADPGPYEPGGAGASPQDPTRSVPRLVAEVAAARGLGEDAAALYLQLLALPDPTDRNVARWTGWKPARLKAARAQLAATDLVVQAKRPRAGRSLFLPGGWLALKAPHLPLERWKIPLLTLDGDGAPELGVVVPAVPVPRLFELAWARARQGDGPRFDQLDTERRR